MAKPTKIPTWATGGSAEVVEPPSGKKALGYRAGERPVHGYENWLAKTVGEWLQYLNDATLDGDHTIDGNLQVTGLTALTMATANEVTADALVANTVVQTPSLEATAVAIAGGTATALAVTSLTISNEPKTQNRTTWLTPWCAQVSDGSNSASADCNSAGDVSLVPGQTIVFPFTEFAAGTFREVGFHVTASTGSTYTMRVKTKSGNTVTTAHTSSGSFASGYQLITVDVSGSSVSCTQAVWVEVAIATANATFHNLTVTHRNT